MGFKAHLDDVLWCKTFISDHTDPIDKEADVDSELELNYCFLGSFKLFAASISLHEGVHMFGSYV